jgi:Flp pilus assembly protein CpaB
MNRRVLLLLLIVVVLIVGGGVLLLSGALNGGAAPAPVSTGSAPVVADGPTNVPGTGGGQEATPIILTKIIVAVQELPRGIKIPRDGLDVRSYPRDAVPAYAIGYENEASFNQVVGQIARNDIAREQPILSTMLVTDLTQLAKQGSDAAAILPQNLRAISIPIDQNSSVAYAIRDGDYVDVIGSFVFVDVDQASQSRTPNNQIFTSVRQDGTIEISGAIQGRLEQSSFSQFPLIINPTEPQRPRLATQTIVQAALVVHVGTFPLSGYLVGNTPTPISTATPADSGGSTATPSGPPTLTPTPAVPTIITLGVSPQDAVTLAWMMDAQVPITLTLRSTTNQTKQPTTEVTLRYIVENFQVNEAPALPYALQPALRSVRQLVNGTLVPIIDSFAVSAAK